MCVQAMGKTHDEKYLEYLYPVLNHELFYMRSDAAQSIFNINGSVGLEELKKREASLEIENLKCEPSEKAMLIAMILKIEKGTKGVKEYFLSEEGSESVKYSFPFFYRSGYDFKVEDIELLIFLVEVFTGKKDDWIRKLSKTDYNDFIYFALEGIWLAGKETGIRY